MSGALDELAAKASPRPWFLDGFGLFDAGTWLIGEMALEGNPSHQSDPKATKALATVAVNNIQAAVEALGLLLERVDEGHLVRAEGAAARQSEGVAREVLAAIEREAKGAQA